MEKDTLYKQFIIDHYKNPKNFGSLNDATHQASRSNISCGDEMEVYLKVTDGVVEDLKFEARGCAISIATMSMLSEKLIGMSIEQIEQYENSEVLHLVGMEESSGRVKCALLSIESVREALK